MQGIVGQASDFVEVVSKIDWTLLHEIQSDEERSKKSKAIDEQRCGTVFLREYISPRTSSTVVRVQVVGVCEVRTLAGMPGLVIVLDPACACRWERRRTLKKLYSRSQLAPSWSVKDKNNSVVCQKKNLSSLSSQLAAEEAYTTVSCNKSVVLSNRLCRWASKSENKKHVSMPAGPEAKESPGFFDLMAFFRSPYIFCSAQCGSVLTVERKS